MVVPNPSPDWGKPSGGGERARQVLLPTELASVGSED